MYPIGFSKSRAKQLISVIGEGRDIPAPDRGWSCNEMLQVAGALLFAAMSQGRPDIDRDPSEIVARESGDTTTNALCDGLHMAIDFYSDLTMMVCGGSYDERFEPTLQGVVLRDGGERAFKLVGGGKL